MKYAKSILLLLFLVCPSWAANDPIEFFSTTGLTLTAKLYDTAGLDSSISMTESPASSGRYICTAANLSAVTANEYGVGIFDGSSVLYGTGSLRWDGTAEILSASDAALADLQSDVDGLVSGSITIPVSQVPVDKERTWKVIRGQDGPAGDKSIGAIVGESPVYAIDFANDLPTNGRLESFDAIAISTGTSGGVTFGTLGVDKTQAKVAITAVTAGTYVLKATCTYQSAFGSGTVIAYVTLKVN